MPNEPSDTLSADRHYLETYGQALVLNTRLWTACIVLALIAAASIGLNFFTAARALKVKPIIVRVDNLGRHETVPYDEATTSAPGENELKSDLHAFVVKHFGRRHGAVSRDFPESLFFLDPAYGDSIKRDETEALTKFINTPAAEETDLSNIKVRLTETTRPPFRAVVDFDQIHYLPGTRKTQKKPETFTVQIEYELRDSIPNAYVPFNPRGLQITYFKASQASF
jgi:type IV secretory pathway component VirB8